MLSPSECNARLGSRQRLDSYFSTGKPSASLRLLWAALDRLGPPWTALDRLGPACPTNCYCPPPKGAYSCGPTPTRPADLCSTSSNTPLAQLLRPSNTCPTRF